LAASSASMKATLASVAASTAQSMACSSLRSVAEPGAGIPRLAAVVKHRAALAAWVQALAAS
jgi:hypothetical protein